MTEEMIKNHLEYHFEANPKHPYAQLRHIQPLSDKISGRNKQLIEEQRQHGLQRINLRIQNIETTLNDVINLVDKYVQLYKPQCMSSLDIESFKLPPG